VKRHICMWTVFSVNYKCLTVCRSSTKHAQTHYPDLASQSLLMLVNAVFLAEKQQIHILKSLVLPEQGSNPLSTAL